jgi:hypothetical protein
LAAAQSEVERLTNDLTLRAGLRVPDHSVARVAHEDALEAAAEALAEAETRLDALTMAAMPLSEQFRNNLREYLAASPDERERAAEATDWIVFEDDEISITELRRHLRATVDCVLVRRASGQGLASSIPDRILVLRRGEAPAELLEGNKRSRSTSFGWIRASHSPPSPAPGGIPGVVGATGG